MQRIWTIGFLALGLAVGLAGCDRGEEGLVEEVRPEPRRTERIGRTARPRPEPARRVEATPPPSELAPASAPPPELDPRLLDPASLDERAPGRYVVELSTTKGPIHLEVTRAWAPLGADRFYNLVKAGYFTDIAFFRVIEGFMAQAGIHGDPRVNAAWRTATIEDDPVEQRNTRGMVSFATSGPNSRVNQFFINFADNSRLDPMGFSPFARVRPEDMAVVDRLYAGYGEGAPRGRGPVQGLMQSRGNEYLRAEFPELDYIETARIVEP